MLNDFIYSKEGEIILKCVHNALLKCISYGKNHEQLIPENPELIKCFKSLEKRTFDLHISEGVFDTHRTRGELVFPRILKITLSAYKDAKEVKVLPGEEGILVIPSPLHILYYSLIVPDQPQTASYSLASCRTLLFNLIEESYLFSHPHEEFKILSAIDEEGISLSMNSLSKNIRIGARWPSKEINVSVRKPIRTYTNILVGHFLSMKGITHLWFKNRSQAEKYLALNETENYTSQLSKKITYPKFRLSNKYEELPDSGEITNQLFGIPIPIKGADVVFFGGLKPSSSGGMVIGISGQAGIGKTSFALAVANSLAPMGIICFYLSLEESIADIQKRLYSLQTPFEKELSLYKNPREWFFSTKATERLTLNSLLDLVEKVKNKSKNNSHDTSVKTCDSIIIIDNLNEFINENDYNLAEKLIEHLRELNSIVILIGGDGVLEKLKMEYLVDIGVKLMHEGLEKKGEKPLRLFNLYKTRHQLSRQGTHVFHMSGGEGFRISPQIPSQMDRKEKLKKLLHDETKIIHTLNYLNDDGLFTSLDSEYFINRNKKEAGSFKEWNDPDRKHFFKLFPRTHILVHGYGSAGKAGFSLKLLLTPPVEKEIPTSSLRIGANSSDYSSSLFRRKVLIISFLYPQKYYHDLIHDKIGLQRKVSQNYPHLKTPIVDYLVFYPGFISPEDFINKITRKLDEAILEGQPFTGVLIDGLHNVFLQFIRLQENDMVWPLLYNILARYDLTVVSTFTNFAMNDRLLDDDPGSRNNIINQALPDHMLLQKGMAPFLHALVKASDFYFFLEQLVLKSGEAKYLLSVKSAISQNVPTELLEWDRQKNVFINIYPYKEILKMKEAT